MDVDAASEVVQGNRADMYNKNKQSHPFTLRMIFMALSPIRAFLKTSPSTLVPGHARKMDGKKMQWIFRANSVGATGER